MKAESDNSNNLKDIQIYPNYLISLTATTGGTVTGPKTAVKDSDVTVSATPSAGYMFNGWYENGKMLYGVSSTYTFKSTSGRTLKAMFKPNDLKV